MVPGFAQNRKTMTVSPTALKVLEDISTRVYDPIDVVTAASDMYKINIGDFKMLGKRSYERLSNARQLAATIVFILSKKGRLKEEIPLGGIAKIIGWVNHSTVIHARRKVRDLFEVDTAYREEIAEVLDQFGITSKDILNIR